MAAINFRAIRHHFTEMVYTDIQVSVSKKILIKYLHAMIDSNYTSLLHTRNIIKDHITEAIGYMTSAC